MTASRDELLNRIRQAVSAGNRAGAGGAIPERGAIGYQGAATDRTAHFMRELEGAGGKAHRAESPDALASKLVELLQAIPGRRVLAEMPSFLHDLDLPKRLTVAGKQLIAVRDLEATTCREVLFAADIGITGVDYLIAETGSIVLASDAGRPRSTSLLPPVHVAIAGQSQILADLFDLYDTGINVPSSLTLITGPSKTGDIELRLVTGVHGPGEVHVVICSWA